MAAGVSERTGGQVACPLPGRRHRGACSIAASAPHAGRGPHCPGAGGRPSLALRRLRMTAAEIAELLSMPLSTVSAVLQTTVPGQALAPGSRLSHPIATSAAVRASSLHVDVKKLGKIGCPGHRAHRRKPHRQRARGVGWEFVHVCVDDATRLAYVEVLPDERSPRPCVALPASRRRPLQRPRHPRRTGNDRQRQRLPLAHAHPRLPSTRPTPPPPAPAPTGRAQTGKQNASSAPCSTAGHTAPSTQTHKHGTPP